MSERQGIGKSGYQGVGYQENRISGESGQKTEDTEIVLNFEFLVLSYGVRRWRMSDFICIGNGNSGAG